MPKLTKRFVEAAPPGRHYDTELAGFGLAVGATGSRAYFVEYRVGYGRGGKKHRMVIGRHGVLTPAQARTEAARLLGQARAGADPMAIRRAPGGPTILMAMAEWLAEVAAKRRDRTARDYRRMVDKHVTFGDMPLREVSHGDIARLHVAMAGTPSEANHTLRCLSAFFAWSERRRLRPEGSNPVRGVERFREEPRKRYLSDAELGRLARALAVAEHRWPWPVAAVRLLLLTGMRMGEVLALRWENVDLQAGVLRLPDSKTGAKDVWLNEPAAEVLAQIPRIAGVPFVICGASPDGSLGDLERPWRRIRKAALLDDVRLHDLRHTHASVAVAGGLSLPLIGGLLGHTQPRTTARYAHLGAGPLRAASELVGKRLAEAMRKRR